jgi:hypothetical protein
VGCRVVPVVPVVPDVPATPAAPGRKLGAVYFVATQFFHQLIMSWNGVVGAGFGTNGR